MNPLRRSFFTFVLWPFFCVITSFTSGQIYFSSNAFSFLILPPFFETRHFTFLAYGDIFLIIPSGFGYTH